MRGSASMILASTMNRRREKASIKGDTSVLPCDVVYDILLKLPLKSLSRFKCVSKPWRKTISSSKFNHDHVALILQSHVNSDIRDLSCLFFRETDSDHFVSVVNYKGNSTWSVQELELPWKNYGSTRILGSCNGLLLLHTECDYENMLLLVNPLTKAYNSFSCPQLLYCDGNLSGLCYDSSEEDYKAILGIRKDEESTKYDCAVFSFKHKSWRVVGDFIYSLGNDDKVRRGRCDTTVNGNLHWVIPKNPLKDLSAIVCFDLVDKKIKEVPVPTLLKSKRFDILAIGECLCLYNEGHCRAGTEQIEVWMMKQYGDEKSWSCHFVLQETAAELCNTGLYPRPVSLTKRGEVIVEGRPGLLLVCNPNKENKVRMSLTFSSAIMVKYVGTLVAPPGSEELAEGGRNRIENV